MTDSRHIGVVGGGPAGAFAASLLAAAGRRVTVYDEKLAWEKPCGGGLTSKALNEYPFLRENGQPKKIVREANLTASNGFRVHVRLRSPIYIYSRFVLNSLLLNRAEAAGSELVQDRVTALERLNGESGPWLLRGARNQYTADFLILATGARNPFRNFRLPKRPEDAGMTLGYFVPGTQDALEVQFLRNYEGYIWVFPRHDHLSVGICGRLLQEPSWRMKERLHEYMDRRGIRRQGSAFFSHPLPSLTHQSWRAQRPAGRDWAGVGDAAGLVDPITGEGLYYALRSADLLVQCYLEDRVAAYPRRLRRDFGRDLEIGARLCRRFYTGTFLGAPITTRMIQFGARSRTFNALMQDLFAGSQGYIGLKQRLYQNLNVSIREILASLLRLHSVDAP